MILSQPKKRGRQATFNVPMTGADRKRWGKAMAGRKSTFELASGRKFILAWSDYRLHIYEGTSEITVINLGEGRDAEVPAASVASLRLPSSHQESTGVTGAANGESKAMAAARPPQSSE